MEILVLLSSASHLGASLCCLLSVFLRVTVLLDLRLG